MKRSQSWSFQIPASGSRARYVRCIVCMAADIIAPRRRAFLAEFVASVLSHGLRPSKAAWPPLLWRFSPGVTLGQLRVCETRGVDCRCLDVQSSERGQTFGKVGPRASATRTAAKRSKPAETFALGWPVSSSGPCSYLWQHSRDSWQRWSCRFFRLPRQVRAQRQCPVLGRRLQLRPPGTPKEHRTRGSRRKSEGGRAVRKKRESLS